MKLDLEIYFRFKYVEISFQRKSTHRHNILFMMKKSRFFPLEPIEW